MSSPVSIRVKIYMFLLFLTIKIRRSYILFPFCREPEAQKESYPAMSPRLFTYNPSTGIQRIRKYDAYEDYSSSYNRPTSPSVSERYRDMPTSPTIDRFRHLDITNVN